MNVISTTTPAQPLDIGKVGIDPIHGGAYICCANFGFPQWLPLGTLSASRWMSMRHTIADSIEREKKQKRARLFFKDFLNLRKRPFNDLYFMVRSPIRIIKIHMKAIVYKKFVSKLRSPFNQKRNHYNREHTTSDYTLPLRF